MLGQWHMAVATSMGSSPRCSQVLSSLWNEHPGPTQTLAALGRVGTLWLMSKVGCGLRFPLPNNEVPMSRSFLQS